MLTKFVAKNLNGHISCDFDIHPDLNLITGKNGSGKTTTLKVIWYLMSANIERIPRELQFDLLDLTADNFHIVIEKERNNKYKFTYDAATEHHTHSLHLNDISQEVEFVRNANAAVGNSGSSIFFPTFRRIEGGFSMEDTPRSFRERSQHIPSTLAAFRAWEFQTAAGNEAAELIQRGFSELSRRLSIFNHTFVASISTDDIVRLLTTKYAAISETTNRTHKTLSEEIFSLINKYDELSGGRETLELNRARSTLSEIKQRVNRFNDFADATLRPFTTLSELVKDIFTDKGIEVSENIVLGDVNNIIRSQILSSGEKHMLSFLCYNAFSDGVTFFIDEPELSLHVDWQRLLFPTLLQQGTRNQFIIATHSPFIYSKYADRELVLNSNR